MMRIEMADWRCAGDGCRDKALCHRARPLARGETGVVTALYVRLRAGERRCDQFLPKPAGGFHHDQVWRDAVWSPRAAA